MFNCGKELLAGQATKEHIPAKALFNGYDSKYKNNRMKGDSVHTITRTRLIDPECIGQVPQRWRTSCQVVSSSQGDRPPVSL